MLVDRFIEVEHLAYDEEELNRILFFLKSIKNLAENTTGGSLTLAVNGDWGTGKTSYLKIAESFYRDYLKYPVLFFEAWKFQKDPDYFLSLVLHLRELAGKDTNLKGKITKLGKIITTTFVVASKTFANVNFNDVKGFLEEYERLVIEGYSKNREEVDKLKSIVKDILSLEFYEDRINHYNQFLWEALFNENFKDDLIAEFKRVLADENHPLVEFYRSKENIFEKILDNFIKIEPAFSLEEIKPATKKLILIIDDLDRLIPENAFKMIEILRFYFDIEDIIILMGVNDRILEKYINKVYHLNDEEISDRFLEKVFQHSYRLVNAELNGIHLRVVNEEEKHILRETLSDFQFSHRKWLKIINRALEKKIQSGEKKLKCDMVFEALLEELYPSFDFARREIPDEHDVETLYRVYTKGMDADVDKDIRIIEKTIGRMRKDLTFTTFPEETLEKIFKNFRKNCLKEEI